MKKLALALSLAGGLVVAMPAQAATTLVYLNNPLTTTGTSFSFGGTTFTFAAQGSSSVAVKNSDPGAIEAFGGFAGIAIRPSASFTNRGTVTYGSTGTNFASFTSSTPDSAISQTSFVGLRATSGSNNYYGFAYLDGRTLIGYGFENVANTAVTATTAIAPVPEPVTWSMMILGMGMIGIGLRRRAKVSNVRFAAQADTKAA